MQVRHGVDDSAKFVLFLPVLERLRYALNIVVRYKVLGGAFLKNLAGVNEQDLVLPVLWFGFVEKDDNARRRGIVKKIFRQVKDAFDEVIVHKPLTHCLFGSLVFPGET